jgi:hypothetical protein
MNRYLSCLPIAALISSAFNTSSALPLLAENAAVNTYEALTLYPDHEDANKFYFMPNSSTFVRDASTGLPAFGLTYWGLSNGGSLADAGAYMVFALRLHSNPTQKAALEKAMAEGKGIAVLPVQSSLIGLNSTQSAQPPLSRLFEEFNFSKKGGRAEDEIGVNSIMTGLGAKVFRSAIDNPMLLKIDYCYMVTGLGPDFDAKIKINWRRVYEHFETHASGGGLFFKWQVDVAIEKLRQQNAVSIEINGGNSTDEEYVRTVVKDVIERLFKAELEATPAPGAKPAGFFSFSRFSLKFTKKEELKEEVWTLKRRDLIEREFCVPVSLTEISKHKNELVRNADL